MSFTRSRKKNARRGVAVALAETLMIVIVVAVGFALWGFVNSSAGSVENAYSQNTADTINLVNERFMVPHVTFLSNSVTVYFYNCGDVTTSVKAIWIWNQNGTQSEIFTGSPLPITLSKGNMTQVRLSLSFNITPGQNYYVKAQGEFGNVYTYSGVA